MSGATATATAGSYDPARTTAGGLDGEVKRLEAQAALSFDQEAALLRAIGVADAGTLLEIGAGSGAVTRRLADAFPATSLIAIDVDARMLTHVPHSSAARVIADALRLPLSARSVDCVLIRYVLQHVADPVGVLREASRVLRPGGRLVLVDVDDACWGLAEPVYPELARIHAKIAEAQNRAGGSRTVGRKLTRLLRRTGYHDVALHLFTSSTDDHPVEAFAPHLGPERLHPLVADGTLSLADLALAADRWNRFQRDPDAWVALVGFLAVGTAPP